jgi:AcrR family transcriptional regulator
VRDRLLQFTQALVQDVAQIAELGLMPLFLDFYGLSLRNAEVRAFLQTTYTHSYQAALIPLIQQGIDRGEFRPVDPVQTVITLTALYEGLIVLWTIDPQMVWLETQFTAAVELLLAGLATEA